MPIEFADKFLVFRPDSKVFTQISTFCVLPVFFCNGKFSFQQIVVKEASRHRNERIQKNSKSRIVDENCGKFQ